MTDSRTALCDLTRKIERICMRRYSIGAPEVELHSSNFSEQVHLQLSRMFKIQLRNLECNQERQLLAQIKFGKWLNLYLQFVIWRKKSPIGARQESIDAPEVELRLIFLVKSQSPPQSLRLKLFKFFKNRTYLSYPVEGGDK